MNTAIKKIGSSQLGQKWKKHDVYSALANLNEIVSDSRNLLIYDHSAEFWYRVLESEESTVLMDLLDPDVSNRLTMSDLRNIAEKLKSDPRKIIDFDKRSFTNQYLLNVQNTVVDVRTDEMLQRKSSMGFDYVLNFTYKSDASMDDAPNFKKWLETSCDYPSNMNKSKRLLQMLGYSISSVCGKKCCLFVGESNTGKSLICNMLEAAIGEKNVSNIPIDKLGNRFNLGELCNVRLNVHREMSGAILSDVSAFKGVVSNERMMGERKHQNPYYFTPRCKLVFAGNTLPGLKVTDRSLEAITDRMCVLVFTHSIRPEDRDYELYHKLIQEKDIIFSLAVKELPELIANNFQFAYEADSEQYMANYRNSYEALPNFIQECCHFSPEAKVHQRTFIQAFIHYCNDNVYTRCNSDQDIIAYVSALDGVEKKKIRLYGKSLAGFLGIELRSDVLLDGQDSML